MNRTLRTTTCLLLSTGVAHALPAAELDAYARPTLDGYELTVLVQGAEGDRIQILVGAPDGDGFHRGSLRSLGWAPLESDGTGHLTLEVPNLPYGHVLRFGATYRGDDGLVSSPTTDLAFGGGGTGIFCQLLDFDYQPGDGAPETGQTLGDEWSVAGITISADNNVPGHPDKAIVFDSGNPTGDDDDLATPGYHETNTEALGQLLIIAEDDGDGNGDGLVDDPDDEMGGGTVHFDFESPVIVCSITLVDIDDAENTELRFHMMGGGMETVPVADLGDNSVQTVFFQKEDVTRFDVVFGGSGGIANVELEPCPLLVNLDETPLGIPLDLQAGEEILEQYAFLGLHISGTNHVAGHPDKVILFDSENPTGEDGDLITPGYGIGNDEALGFVLIIAEDDVDADGDGYVDDPDDEGGGGTMDFRFDYDIVFHSMKVLDVDGTRNDYIALYDDTDSLIETIPFGALGDNSVQTISSPNGPVAGVRRVELNLDGSGATTRLRWCPDR